jgi:hypothetical protein
MKLQNRIAEYLPEALRPDQFGGGADLPDVQEWIKKAEQVVKEHPGPSLAAAFALGVVLAWWIKRT